VGLVMPALKGKLDGLSVRVPHPTVSLTDLVCVVEKNATEESVNGAFAKAANGPMKGILGFEERPLVSSDFKADPRSSIVDAQSTKVIDGSTGLTTGGTLVKVLSWYDNEWGYACRLVELGELLGSKL
jgi:glyceraldehyde 3-phosphate dehydrogenase